MKTDSILSASLAPISAATATTSFTSAAFSEDSSRLSNIASDFTPISSASMLTSTTSARFEVKSVKKVASSFSLVSLLRPDLLCSTFSSNLVAAKPVTSTYESAFARSSGSSRSISPALSSATASVPLSSSPTPLDAPSLSSSDSFNSSSDGASSSEAGAFASEASGLPSTEIPMASPAASTSAWIAVIIAAETCPSCIGSITPLGPIPEVKLWPGPSMVGSPPPRGVKAISPRSIEVFC